MQTFLKVKVKAAPDYEDAQVKLCATEAVLTLRLSGGLDKAETKVAAGIYKLTGEIVTVYLSITYRSDFFANRIEICGSEAVQGLEANVSWHCPQQEIRRMRLYQEEPGLRSQPQDAVMQDTLEAMRQGVLDAALDAGISVSWKPALGPYKDQYFVLRDGRISHIFDPEYEDFEDCDTVPVNSHFQAVGVYAVGTLMTNVTNSTGDHYPRYTIGQNTLPARGSWISFWSFFVHNGNSRVRPPCCYYAANNANAHNCSSPNGGRWTFGAHSLVWVQGINRNVPQGVVGASNVVIIPACVAANNNANGNFVIQVNTSYVQLRDYYIYP